MSRSVTARPSQVGRRYQCGTLHEGGGLRARAPEWLDIVVVNDKDAGAIRRELENADVLLHVLTPVIADMFDAAPRLKLVQKIGVGINTIDVAAAKARGVSLHIIFPAIHSSEPFMESLCTSSRFQRNFRRLKS